MAHGLPHTGAMSAPRGCVKPRLTPNHGDLAIPGMGWGFNPLTGRGSGNRMGRHGRKMFLWGNLRCNDDDIGSKKRYRLGRN
jgi:hypothetical protein